jgi:hypothetical protein
MCDPVWDATISQELFLVEIMKRTSISNNVLYDSHQDKNTFYRT